MRRYWPKFWMRFAGTGPLGRLATRLATLYVPPYKGRRYLARFNKCGYISPSAKIYCHNLSLGRNIFLGDRVALYQSSLADSVKIGDRACIHQDGIIETGEGGSVSIGEDTHIQPRLQISAYKGSVQIGSNVQIAPNCAFYPYDHSIAPDELINKQPLQTKGGIVVEDNVWLGFGVVVLDGVTIGKGAVVGAGAVVTSSIPQGAIAAGVPSHVIRYRDDHARVGLV